VLVVLLAACGPNGAVEEEDVSEDHDAGVLTSAKDDCDAGRADAGKDGDALAHSAYDASDAKGGSVDAHATNDEAPDVAVVTPPACAHPPARLTMGTLPSPASPQYFPTHAAEVVRNLDGEYFITHAGWGQGGLFIAPLTWTCE
jgi:hypothetical protein